MGSIALDVNMIILVNMVLSGIVVVPMMGASALLPWDESLPLWMLFGEQLIEYYSGLDRFVDSRLQCLHLCEKKPAQRIRIDRAQAAILSGRWTSPAPQLRFVLR
jgi:hypothetical protein